MTHSNTKHHRRSIRLQDYDYSRSGAYFVTICTHQRLHLFGDIADSKMKINDWGEIVKQEWEQTAKLRDYVRLDAFIVMPNHIHGIILIVDTNDRCRGMMDHALNNIPQKREFSKPIAHSLPTIIGAFKASVTRQINRRPDAPEHPIWQRNYHEHIIRNEADFNRIREYVLTNPAKWESDIFFN